MNDTVFLYFKTLLHSRFDITYLRTMNMICIQNHQIDKIRKKPHPMRIPACPVLFETVKSIIS